MTESCAEYWESQGVDPLDAALTIGCHPASGGSGHDVLGAVIFLLLLAIGAAIACRSEPVDEKHDFFR